MALTEEQREIQSLAADFADGVLRPVAATHDARRVITEEIRSQLAETGFYGLTVPEASGGLGMDAATWVLVLEGLAWGDPAVALHLAGHGAVVAAAAASDEAGAWLADLASGERVGACPLGGGSDNHQGQDDATGPRPEQAWMVNLDAPAVAWLAASDGAAGYLALFDPDSAGVVERAQTAGFRGAWIGSWQTSQVGGAHGPVPAAGVESWLRLGVAAVALGVGRAAREHAVAYGQERRQFNQPIASFGAIRDKIAQGRAEGLAAAALVMDAAQHLGSPAGSLASSAVERCAAAKVVASGAAMRAADEAVQIYGGYGYMREYPVERLMRDAKGTEVLGGANEHLRAALADQVLTEAGTP